MKHVGHVIAVAALTANPLVLGRPEPPEPCISIPGISCGGMPYLTGEEKWAPDLDENEEYDWAPNRLPAAWMNLRPGNYCEATGGNYRGLQSWWYEEDDNPGYEPPETWQESEAFDDLHFKLVEAYGHGFRRIILNLPAGMVRGQNMASSQWWSMPEWKRNLFTCLIADWLTEHPDTQFEIYSAFQVNDPASLCMKDNIHAVPTTMPGECVPPPSTSPNGQMFYPCDSSDTAYSPSPFVQTDVCLFHTTNSPWQHLGITRVWLDWSHTHWTQFHQFPYCPLYAPGSQEHHFLGMEAFPMDFTDPDNPEIITNRAIHCPAIIFDGHIPGVDSDQSWEVSAHADTTELMVLVNPNLAYFESQNDGDSSFNMFDVLAWTQRGFVLACAGVGAIGVDPESPAALKMIEYMKRVYDFGTLYNRADFNGDEVVNSTDQSDFNAAYALYSGQSGCNWVHGDLSGDTTPVCIVLTSHAAA
ncbi:MAG: hypothetical protein IT435_14630 [Phycisphaerales bacterium]|nr:hypothetical protein [Phycisphaerales bacterium]